MVSIRESPQDNPTAGRFRRLWEGMFDLLWPRLSGDPGSEPSPLAPISITDESILNAAEKAADERLGQADERFRTVEGKLMPLLALISVVSAVLTGSVPLVLSGRFDNISTGEFVPVAVLLMYVAAQVIRTLEATVNGLGRRSYARLSSADIDPEPGETLVQYRLRLLNLRRSNFPQNEWSTDDKVSQLAVAHKALRNALYGVAALIISAVTIAGVRIWC